MPLEEEKTQEIQVTIADRGVISTGRSRVCALPKRMGLIIILLFAWLGTSCAVLESDVSTEEFPGAELDASQLESTSRSLLTSPSEPPASTQKKMQEQSLAASDMKVPLLEEVESPTFEGETSHIKPQDVLGVSTPVQINVEGLSLPDFLTHALGNVLKVTFFLEEEVKTRKDLITLRMPQPLPPDKALKIILGLLEKNRLSAQEKEGALYIAQIPAGTAPGGAAGFGRVIRGESAHINQFVPLKYIGFQEISRLLGTLYQGLVKLSLYPEKNVIVLSGSPEKVKIAIQFVEALDIPLIQGRVPLLLSLTYWDADAFILQLTTVLQGMGFPVAQNPKDPGVWFVPLTMFNRILALAPDKRAARYIQNWTKELDKPNAGETAEQTFTYSPRFSKASNLVEVIQKVYGKGTRLGSQGQGALGNTGMGSGPAQTGSKKGAQGGMKRSGLALSFPEGSTPLDGGARMAADDLRNLVIVVTTPARYEKLREFLQKLDVPSRQVLIEVTLAELTLDDQFQFGLEWALRNVNVFDGILNLGTLGGLGLSTTQGLTGGFVTDSQKFEAVLNAFASNNKLKLLSSPRLTVLDNQEANIQIGDEVPIITSEVSAADINAALPTVNRNIEMRQTGVLLRIKPTINTEGLLTLDISQEVSDAKATTTSDIQSPTIFNRRIKTSVVIGHGESIFLGGLISEIKDTTVTKVPFLGDIPWLGELFKSRANRTRKTELIILITPRILTNVDEAVLVTQEMQESLEWYKELLPIMGSGKRPEAHRPNPSIQESLP